MKVDTSRSQIQLYTNNRQAGRNAQLLLGEFGEQILIAGAERGLFGTTVPKCTAWC